MLGPELLTYDQVAETLSDVLGRRIEHVKLSREERHQGLVGAGISDYFAGFLSELEEAASAGFETRMNDEVERVTGKRPKSLGLFVQENKETWV